MKGGADFAENIVMRHFPRSVDRGMPRLVVAQNLVATCRRFREFATMLHRATIDDADKLGAVHVASWRETYAGILPDDMLAGLSIEARSSRKFSARFVGFGLDRSSLQ